MVTEERREENRKLYERVAVLESEIMALTKILEDQGRDIKALLELANKSRGALFTVMSLSAAAGGLVAWALTHFFKSA